MTEVETDVVNEDEQPARRFHFDWLLPVLIRPKATLARIGEEGGRTWQTPMLVLTVLALVVVLISAPARLAAAQVPAQLPPDFQNMPAEMQAQFQQGMQVKSGPMFVYVFPALGAAVGLWFGWFILGILLHLALTLSGSRSSSASALNLTAWAHLPFGVRLIIQGIYALSTQSLVTSPGLSGFFPTGTGRLNAFLASASSSIDLYWIWMIVLVLIGLGSLTGLAKRKAWTAALGAVGLVLILQALPGFLGAVLGGLNTTRPFLFF
jgi:hypothetical protein